MSALHDSELARYRAPLAAETFRADAVSEYRSHTGPVAATSPYRVCSRLVLSHLVLVSKSAGVASVDEISSYHRGADFATFSGRLAIDFGDVMSDCLVYMYPQKLDRDEEGSDQHDSCRRVESVGEGQGTEDDTYWNTGHPYTHVRPHVGECCLVCSRNWASQSELKRRWWRDEPSVSIPVPIAVPVHY